MDNDVSVPVGVTNERLLAWVRQMRRLCTQEGDRVGLLHRLAIGEVHRAALL